MEVEKKILLGELEAMGFPEALAAKALSSSGSSSIEDAINWLVDQDNDKTFTEPPEQSQAAVDITVETSKSFHISEQVMLSARVLRSAFYSGSFFLVCPHIRNLSKFRNRALNKKAELEKKQERQTEKDRIRAGKELLEAKRMAEERERRRFLAQRKAGKDDEKRARDRVRQNVQQDKLERQGVLGSPTEFPAPAKPDIALAERTENLQLLDTDILPVKSSALRDDLSECLRSLKRRNKLQEGLFLKYERQESLCCTYERLPRKCKTSINEESSGASRAFQTLLIYVRNVINNPNEEKFRKIRINNPIFQDRIGKFGEGIKFLELCGFEEVEGDNFLFLPRQKYINNTQYVNSMYEGFSIRFCRCIEQLEASVGVDIDVAVFPGFHHIVGMSLTGVCIWESLG
ncbi:ubiquitin-associated domain-containing family protein [Striga asiatica]|uniref:Ubiquitin-associated domain-containing family protein n=1 Tax=Striga asiatica TaxID=4170 RepID=A0A5A7PKX2_STRAF|nr:ubiquitin-associated domain-containing family protein [Striga asiatica]